MNWTPIIDQRIDSFIDEARRASAFTKYFPTPKKPRKPKAAGLIRKGAPATMSSRNNSYARSGRMLPAMRKR